MDLSDEEKRERKREYQRRYRQQNPEKRREEKRRYREANRDKILEQQRRYRQAKGIPVRKREAPEVLAERKRVCKRRHYEANREAAIEYQRRYRQENRVAINQRKRESGYNRTRAPSTPGRHGADYLAWFAVAWEQQEGCCYLCGKPLARVKALVDHDHSCCSPKKSCAVCRRGLACMRRNRLIGQVDDDPDLLRRIADNLEKALLEARARIAEKPRQDEL